LLVDSSTESPFGLLSLNPWAALDDLLGVEVAGSEVDQGIGALAF